MAIDVADSNLYDVADRNSWLNSNTLTSIISGVSIYRPVRFLRHSVRSVRNQRNELADRSVLYLPAVCRPALQIQLLPTR